MNQKLSILFLVITTFLKKTLVIVSLLTNDLPVTKQKDNEKRQEKKQDPQKEELRKELNLDKPLKTNDEVKEFREIEKNIEVKEFNEAETKSWKDLLLDLEHIGKNLEELMLDVDKKLYYNVELKERIEKIEKKLDDISLLIEEVLLTGERAVVYYLKKNKNKPIKLKELYKRFDRKIVNKVINQLYEKGFIKIIK